MNYRNNIQIYLHWLPKMIQVVWVVVVQAAEEENHRQPRKKPTAQTAATRKIQSPFIRAMNQAR